MTANLVAAIERLIERRQRGVDVAREDRRLRWRRHTSHWLRQSRRERAGRWRERLGRVTRFKGE